MTYAPQTLKDLAAYWVAQGGVNLGIVGDAAHLAKGYSYHLGKSDLDPTAYSIKTARDKAGLTEAASAIDLGKLGGSLTRLRVFSSWLVSRARADAPGTSDIREIIWTPDGKTVYRWDRERGYSSAPRTGEADTSHLYHTHVSFYRDSEFRGKAGLFMPNFGATAPDTSTEAPMAGLFTTPRPEPQAHGAIKGTGHSIFRVADAGRMVVADGYDMGIVTHMDLIGVLPAWAQGNSHVVFFRFGQYGTYAAVIRDVQLTPLPDTTKAAVNAALDKAITAINGVRP